jgi:hypothetical protein
MKINTILVAGAVAAALALPAAAATVSVNVDAKANSLATDQLSRGLDTGVSLTAGEVFSISVDPADTWAIGHKTARHLGTADGAPLYRLYTFLGQTFSHGTLVGKIGDGLFFRVGSSYLDQAANYSGVLKLFMWDSNFGDNYGSVTATITTTDVAPVPLPAGAPLLLGAFGLLAMLRRRKA